MLRRAFVCLLLPATAAASPVLPHASGGLDLALDGETTLLAARIHAGAALSLAEDDDLMRSDIGIGVTAAIGMIEPDAPAYARRHRGYTDLGIELQFGVQLGAAGPVVDRVFSSIAVLASSETRTDDAIARTTQVPDGASPAIRVALGANIAKLAHDARHEPRGILLTVLPQQIELTVLRDAATLRYGVTFAYG